MQAKPFQIIASIFPWPRNVPASVTRIPSLSTKTTRAISISTPNIETHKVDQNTTTSQSPELVDDFVSAFWDYQFLFVSQRSETKEPVILRVVDGTVPDDFPSGTYYLTGPGLFVDDHGSTVHPLDGHGYLRAFVFDNVAKNVKFMARYVKTEAQLEEHDPMDNTWQFTHRGPFSVLKGGRKLGNTKVMKNVANTSVLVWGGRLLCLWEGGDPYEIESGTLNTLGRFDVMNGSESVFDDGKESNGNGVFNLATWLLKPILYGVFKMPTKRLLAHYKVDASRDRLLTVSCNAEDMLLPRSNFTFYEYNSDFKLLQKQEFDIPDHLMIHDWAFTDTHYILFANRIKLDVVGAITAVCGLTPMITALSMNPSKVTSPIYLLPRFPCTAGRDWRVPIEVPSQLWLLHVANAYQNLHPNGNFEIQIHASACSYHWFNFQKLFGYNWQNGKLDPSIMNTNINEQGQNKSLPHLIKVSISMDANGDCQNCNVEPLNNWDKSSDFPVINSAFSGSINKYIYAATSSGSRRALPHFPFDMVAKLNLLDNSVNTWCVGSRRFIGEPIFVPSGHDQEDHGYLLLVEYAVSVQRCYLVILNPRKIGEADALVARLEVPRHLNFPLGFHGFWAPDD